jgi:hypothetical protein
MPSMDIFFWRERPLLKVAAAYLGGATTLRRVRFQAPVFTPHPTGVRPPFHVQLYHCTI